jgi:hypothetical protein
MKHVRWVVLVVSVFSFLAVPAPAAPKPVYEKRPTRQETIVASLKASGLPTLEGKWYVIGPFDNTENIGFDTPYPPEREIDLKKSYSGKRGQKVEWQEFPGFRVGHVVDLKKYKNNDDSLVYLYHEIDAADGLTLPVSLGSDDTLTVFLNGKRVIERDVRRPAAPDQDQATLKLQPGKNQLLVKVGNAGGDWAFYICPEFPVDFPAVVRNQLNRDFPAQSSSTPSQAASAEAAHYRIVTLPVPDDAVLEIGGLGVRPDGKLLACSRRGEVWLIANPNADNPADVQFKLYASGLHEALGLLPDGNDAVYVVQRPELTRLIDKDGDGTADEFVTVCDKWGVSGDYHEFAFGPARDKDGNFFVTLNVGFGGGHQAKVPWRGWCVKITPKGELIPWAYGLRSPNGVNFSPDGDLFYCDNQGEWVATNKMHHIRKGEFYGHQAGLRWVKQSPFADRPDQVLSGMLYDGQPAPGKTEPKGLPDLTPPVVWFPYGRMGQSASEPVWDTTGGKFGPFAGQCFVGDQTKSMIMRVVLEKINGRYQGACIPFRSGFQCGINRMAFGPDGSLYVGETNRGWGSVGGKPFGLQRLVYTGLEPLEIHSMKQTRDGFKLTFTKPLDPASADKPEAYSLQSFTYNYWSTYGSPEVDKRAEKVEEARVDADGKSVHLVIPGRRRGRVYELHLNGVKAADGAAVLHPEAYYTLNELP